MIFGKKKMKRNENNVPVNITFHEQIRNHYNELFNRHHIQFILFHSSGGLLTPLLH